MPAAFIPVSGFPLSHELFRVAGGSPGWQVAGNIFRSQVSAIGYQVRVRVRDLNLYVEAETRDLRIR